MTFKIAIDKTEKKHIERLKNILAGYEYKFQYPIRKRPNVPKECFIKFKYEPEE